MIEKYMDTYDLVIAGDGSLQPVNFILKKLFEKDT